MPGLLDRVKTELETLKSVWWLVAAIVAMTSIVAPLVSRYVIDPWLWRRTVLAREFDVKDDAGTTRASIGLGKDMSVALQLFDAGGSRRLAVSLGQDGRPLVSLFEGNNSRASLGVDQNDGVALTLSDVSASTSAAQLAIGRDGSVILGLGSQQQQIGIRLLKTSSDGMKKSSYYRPALQIWDLSRNQNQPVWSAPPGN